MQFKMKVAVDTGPSLMYTNHRAFFGSYCELFTAVKNRKKSIGEKGGNKEYE